MDYVKKNSFLHSFASQPNFLMQCNRTAMDMIRSVGMRALKQSQQIKVGICEVPAYSRLIDLDLFSICLCSFNDQPLRQGRTSGKYSTIEWEFM